MRRDKVQGILRRLSESGIASNESISDLVITLGDVHEQVGSALLRARHEIAPQKEDMGEESADDFVRNLDSSFEAFFNEGGILSAAEYLAEALSDFGVFVDLYGLDDNIDYINMFIREYGLKEFFLEEFEDSHFFSEEAGDTSDEGPVEAPAPRGQQESVKIFEDTPEEAGVEPQEPLVYEGVAADIFNSKTDFFADRLKVEPSEVKSVSWNDNLTPQENIFRKVSTTDDFFESEKSGFNYADRFRAAKDADGNITALTFHPVFRALGADADGLSVDSSSEPPTVSVSLDKMAAARLAVNNAIDSIKDDLSRHQSKLEGAAIKQEGMAKALESYNGERRSLANKLDDLLAAVKKRDSHITNLLHVEYRKEGFSVSSALKNRRYELSAFFRDPSSDLSRSLAFVAQMLVFLDVQKNVFHLGGGGTQIPKQFKDNYSTRLGEQFHKEFSVQLHNKIRSFFSRESTGPWSRSSFCSYIAHEIQRRNICLLAYNKEFQVKQSYWNYTSCSVCGKNIYTRSTVENPKGGGRKGTVDRKEYSEYNIDMYSLFTTDGQVITKDMLEVDESSGEKRSFPPPEDNFYTENKTWAEIEDLIASDSKSKHIEGTVRRSEALRQLGARKLMNSSVPISSLRYRCPYSSETDRPSSLTEALDLKPGERGKALPGCGLYIDPADAVGNDGTLLSTESLQPTRAWGQEEESEKLFLDKLNAEVSSGRMDEEAKDRFIKELRRRSSGGWKFSNKFFNCPTKINIPEDSRNERSIKEGGYLRRYNYIASPISGPIQDGSISYADEERSSVLADSPVYPPLDEQGGFSPMSSGTFTYLVCGAKTSLSSFSRDPSDAASLPNLIKKLMIEAKNDHDLSYKVQALIETLIALGVDPGDLIPFIENPSSPELAVDALEQSGRLNKISHLLAIAMASPINLEGRVKGTSFNRMDVLGDVRLTCHHGHTFSIKDSVYFGITHTGINLRNRSASRYSEQDVISSGILFNDGPENFKNSLRLSDKSGRRYVQIADESDLIGLDSSRKYTYDEWREVSSNINRAIFPGADGSHYGFSSVPRTFVWGSEQRAKLSSALEREAVDPKTRTYLESSEEASIGGEKDSDGKLLSFDAAAAAAFNEFDQSSRTSFSFSSESMVSLGAEGYVTSTSGVGRLLRSYLNSVQGWLKLSTTLDINTPLAGKPEAVSPGLEKGSFSAVVMKNISLAIEAVIRDQEDLDDELSIESREFVDKSIAHFEQNILNRLFEVDRKILYLSSETVRDFLAIGIVRSIVMVIPEIFSEDASLIETSYKMSLMKGGTVDYSVLNAFEINGNTVGGLIDQVIEALAPSQMADLDKKRTLYDPLAIGKGDKWQPEGIVSKEGVSFKIAKMKGKEYMGRVLEAASALYLADLVSEAYNLYMRDAGSNAYIGYDIGLDLSSAEKVLALTPEDIDAIVVGVSDSEAQSLDEDDLRGFYELHFDNVMSCVKDLRRGAFTLRTACTSSKYMDKAIRYITDYLSEMVDETSGEEDPKDVARAKVIIDNIMTNEPFTTINLNSDGKYRKYFGGEEAADTEALLPVFGAALMKLNSDRAGSLYPIYKLSDIRGTYHSFDLSVPKPNAPSHCYVLSRAQLPDAEYVSQYSEELPEAYVRGGWKVFLVKTGKSPSEYSDIEGKESGLKRGISTYYHPSTSTIVSESGDVVGYENVEMGLNTSETLFAGPLTVRSGMTMAFPPTPLAGVSNVGVPIPIDYKGVDFVRGRKKVFPVVGTRIPVEISSEESDATISVDMSDFILRDPPEEALEILNKIDRTYASYKRDIRIAIIDNASDAEQKRIKDRYKKIISGLNSTYRGLPLYVGSDRIGTSKSGFVGGIHSEKGDRAERFDARLSAYLPFVDWTTMHKMLSSEAFGPEWGGHQLWGAGDSGSDLKDRRREAVESFIIRTHNLDYLAEQIGEKVDLLRKLPVGTTEIDPTDLLDPVGRLFSKEILSPKEIKDLFSYNFNPEDDKYDASDAAWLYVDEEKREKAIYNAGIKMEKIFPTWVKGSGSFHSIGSVSKKDSMTGEPLGYIKLMNVIFPSNAIPTGEAFSPRQRLERARGTSHPDIISVDDLYDYDIISGAGTDPVYFPLPKDEKGLKKYRKDLKGVRHIAVARYAEAMSEYLADFIRQDLFVPIEAPEKKEAITSYGLIKFSKKLNANMYLGGTINDEGLAALWKLINE